MLPKGFSAAGLHSGIAKKKEKKDTALFASEFPCVAAGMFTSNLVKAAPVLVSMEHLKTNSGAIRAIVANSSNANACNGKNGILNAEKMCAAAARALKANQREVLVASTGVIGIQLPVAKIEAGIRKAVNLLSSDEQGFTSAVEAIMTTDTFAKIAFRAVRLGGKTITIWGCTKGSGMIHPDVKAAPHATMLSFILTDAALDPKVALSSLKTAAENSYNCVDVDSDTSTNDTVFLLANGAAGNAPIKGTGSDYAAFAKALNAVCLDLAKMMARDGEGATKLVEIEVRNAASDAAAKQVASTVATSPLVKTALFGNDANWGRIMAAAGRAGIPLVVNKIDVYLGKIKVVKAGEGTKYSEAAAKKVFMQKEVRITLDLHQGKGKAIYYTCDFSFDYVKINASYRS